MGGTESWDQYLFAPVFFFSSVPARTPMAADPQSCHCPGVGHPSSGISALQNGSHMDHGPSWLSLLQHEVPPSKSISLPVSSVMSPSTYLFRLFHVLSVLFIFGQLSLLNMFEHKRQVLLRLAADLADDWLLTSISEQLLVTFTCHQDPVRYNHKTDTHNNMLFFNSTQFT